MIKYLRRTLHLSDAGLSDAEVLRLAQQECAKRGLPYTEPVVIIHGLTAITVVTNPESRGANVRVVLNPRTGAIRSVSFSPR